MGNTALEEIRWPLLFAAALLLSGCPYGSDFPLGSPADAVTDDALLGTWKSTVEDDEELTVTIRAAGDRQLLITAESESVPAFVTEMGGQRFLNIREQESYFFAQYRIEADRLRLRIVDDALFEGQAFSSAEELRDFVRANLADPRLYAGEDCQEWVRVGT